MSGQGDMEFCGGDGMVRSCDAMSWWCGMLFNSVAVKLGAVVYRVGGVEFCFLV